MKLRIWLGIAAVAGCLLGMTAQTSAEEKVLMSVSVRAPKVVFNIRAADASGNYPSGITEVKVFADILRKNNISSNLVAVFHNETGRFVLNDESYNRIFKVNTGNPAKSAILELQKSGVKIEVCYKELKRFGGGTRDLLPSVVPTIQGLLRIVELSQQGYTIIQP